MRYINRHYLSIYLSIYLGLSINAPLFILGPLPISETNRARKLKFGTLVVVDIYEC